MRTWSLNSILFVTVLATAVSCSSPKAKQKEESKFPVFNEEVSRNLDPGVVGVYKVPTVLAISMLDSAAMPDVGKKVANCYQTISEEVSTIGARVNGSLGQIMYNNDSANFKFECFAPIAEVPEREPHKCRIVTLNPSVMLVFNYYGPYQQLYTAYNDMKIYIKEHGLEQTGDVREFYITDPTLENDPKRWLTRVMVPVAPIKKDTTENSKP